MTKEKDNDSLNVYTLLTGPSRPYVHVNVREAQSWLGLSLTERVHLVILTLLAVFNRLYQIGIPDSPSLMEFNIVTMVNNYLKGEFFIDYNPPFIGLFYTAVAKLFGYDRDSLDQFSISIPYDNFPYYQLRILSAFLGAISVTFAYKTLRSTGVSHFVSLFGSFLMVIENSMITEERFILIDGIYIFFISLFLSNHQITKVKEKFGASWAIHLLITSLSLGLVLSAHWSGVFILIYALFSLAYESWTLAEDVQISFRYVWANFIVKSLSYFVISLSIYLALFKAHFDLLNKKGPDYNKLSPLFQHSLENNHLENTFSSVNYNAAVMFRHYKSGKYLHSHEDYYRSSNHQQVTMIDNYDEYNNLFKIIRVDGESKEDVPSLILAPWRVRIKHAGTDSSLVIDPDHKPPLSEQEYNFQVTTDHKFGKKNDDTKKYSFQLKMAHDYCKADDARHALRAIDSVFQIYNEENNCYLLGTPLVLSEGYAEGQNEVICIKEPNYEASLWFIDWNDHPGHAQNKKRVLFEPITFWQKFLEIELYVIKKLYIGNGYTDEHTSTSSDWVFLKRGFTQWADLDQHLVIYLLGNFIIYYMIIGSIGVYGLFKTFQTLSYNPFQTLNSLDSSNYKYDSKTFDYLVLYFLLLLPLSFVQVEIHLFNYLPAVFVGILVIGQSFQWGYEKVPKITCGLILFFSFFAFLAYQKFSPLIYGLPWTEEKCLKMLVSPEWDRTLCGAYHIS